MKMYLTLSLAALAVVTTAHAQDEAKYKNAYPQKPYATSLIEEKVSKLTESEDFLWDINEMERRGLNKAKTKSQPWGGYYWAIDQGGIAHAYREDPFWNIIDPNRRNWRKHVKDYKKRVEKLHSKIYSISEDDLADLSPAEKYDLLLGDTSFDLTNRIWDYTQKWGEKKKYAFVADMEVPEGYIFKPYVEQKIAPWEGFCHGWAVAAGIVPRPLKTVEVMLPNGKKLPFYPTDIKALTTLMWAHSNIQSNVIFEGTRCNSKNPVKDKFGRYLEPECADVHPGVFHTAIVNLVGIQGRSLIVDKSAGFAIANQPVSGYELVYYNPANSDTGTLAKSMVSVREYAKEDNFAKSRNPEATHIVGVSMKLKYTDWEFPKKGKTNDNNDDGQGEMKFNYDLELNRHGEIVGGQWRVKRDGDKAFLGGSTGQPDFLWVAPKNWKQYFTGVSLPAWDFNKSNTPPKAYTLAARTAHSYVFEESAKYLGTSPKCILDPISGTGERLKVDCSFKLPQPQPLIQVVDKLIELSRR